MAAENEAICLKRRAFKGSRFRCLLATHQAKQKVAEFLNSLVHPFAEVTPTDRYMPEGFLRPDEARLGDTLGFLNEKQREAVTHWWLKVRRHANTPNWDIVSTCTILGKQGLVLVEAKAHEAELKANDCCGAGNSDNRDRIGAAIKESNGQLQNIFGGTWSLSSESHFQLANRFSWAFKVASLGVPVVLAYLGFLKCDEMSKPFASHEHWKNRLLAYADGFVPRDVWGSIININAGSLVGVICSAEVNIELSVPES